MKQLEKLVKTPAVSGFETMGRDRLFEIFEKFDLTPKTDEYGNIYGEKKSAFSQFHILIDAHIDEIGLIVTEVLDGGFLRFERVGGIDPTNLLCQEVIVLAKEPIYGVIGAIPPHLAKKEEDKKEELLLIDTGLQNAKELIAPGTPVKLKSSYLKLKNNQISSGAMDDRAGLLTALMAVKKWKQDVNVTVLGSTREELGLQGLELFLKKRSFDLAIVIDVTHGYFRGLNPGRSYPVGEGFTLCYGGILDNRLTRWLEQELIRKEIPYHTELEPSHPGTNAYCAVMHRIPAVMMSIPLKYMHTTVETLSETDLKSLATFLSETDWNKALC
ncbi:MAG: hypothetical protein J6A61_09290 [Clostridia bacterium]|nr:hypothetical protein [Clostridia bacterium]